MTDDRPLRVVLTVDPVLAVPPPGYGGTQRIAAALARGLVAGGHEVTVLAGPGSHTDGARDVTIRYRYPAPAPRRAWWYLRFRRRVRRATRRADVLVSFWREDFLNGAVTAGVPVVLTHHVAVDGPVAPLPGHRTLRVSVSDDQRAHLDPEGWRTVPNGVDVDHLVPARDRRGGYLAFLGRLSPEKGAGAAVRVALRSGRPLRIGGNLPSDAAARAAFDADVAPYLGRGVEWLGELDDVGKRDLLRDADALLFPIAGREAFGLVMAEALACGTPVVALRVAAVPEVVRDAETGFICDDEDAMVEAVARVDGIDRDRCRQDCVARFSEDAMVEGYLRVIREAVAGGGLVA